MVVWKRAKTKMNNKIFQKQTQRTRSLHYTDNIDYFQLSKSRSEHSMPLEVQRWKNSSLVMYKWQITIKLCYTDWS